jgi:hypothetical protein
MDLDQEQKNSLIGAGFKLVGELAVIGGKTLMGLYRSSEEIRTEMLNSTGDFLSYIREGGEMDQRAKAAQDATDKAREDAERRQRGNAGARGSRDEDTDPGTPSAIAKDGEQS